MPSRTFSHDHSLNYPAKSRHLIIFWLALFLLVVLRLVYVQIIQGRHFSGLSMENMMRLKVMKAPRGILYDRNGDVLARNRPSFNISVLYYQVKRRKALIANLLKITDVDGQPLFDRKDLDKAFETARFRRFEPVKLADDVGMDVITIVQEHIHELPGILVEQETRREYPNGTLACHALGYLGEIPEQLFDSLKDIKGYHYGDLVGKFGLEAEYEDTYLRGRDGQEYVMVDAFGREIERIRDMPSIRPEKGRDIHLTLDLGIQKAAEEAFPDTQSGAVVAIDPRNGAILALLSSPRFDPNLLSGASKKRSRHWQNLVFDPNQPLNNRAACGQYPPGSTFKLITAAAAYNEDLVGLDETFKPCFGSFRFGSRVAKCWKPAGHGKVGMIDGVKHSCDVYFYQVGLKTGIDYICQYARMFGFARKSGVDLPEEKEGEVLDRETYNAKFKERGWIWTEGQILNSAIGQGQTVTPIQLANYEGALVNGTALYKPHLFAYSTDKNGGKIEFKPKILETITLKEETRRMLKAALKSVIEPGGTGGRAAVEDVDVGGKTGTAQNPQGDDHALFMCVAPLDNAEIAIGVVVENAGHGGSVAAPIAGKILNYYFKKTSDGQP
jgi:penicillin-binding protein 2